MSFSRLASLHAQEILDSRGNPTVRATVILEDGSVGQASVPSGASTGSHEAHELRDGNKKRFGGRGVLKAVRHIEERIAPVLRGADVRDLRALDATLRALDHTPDLSRLGANAVLAVSLAAARAGAACAELPLYRWLRVAYGIKEKSFRLPTPSMNLLNGGAHALWITDIQEFMVLPQQKSFRERVRAGAEVFHALRGLLLKKEFSPFVGDEGGYAVPLKRNRDGLSLLSEASRLAGYRLGKDIAFGIDAASSEWYDAKTKRYTLRTEKKSLSATQLIALWKSWTELFPLVAIEDGLAEDDWEGWKKLTERLGKTTILVGDDLFVTNRERVARGVSEQVANTVLIKPNQIGTLSDTMDTIFLAQAHGYKISVSHRSGDTEDTFIADLAVAVNADFLKAGSASRAERVAKYNRVMEIEREVSR